MNIRFYNKPGIKNIVLIINLMSVIALLSTANAIEIVNCAESSPLNTDSRQWSASIHWENDTFGNTDRYYTNGISFALTHSGAGWMENIADCLPWGHGYSTIGYEITQAMITPYDKELTIPDPKDRPYAGIFLVGITLHVEQANSYHGIKLVTGVMGPSSLAKETQKEVHRHVNSAQPEGWDYQLGDEPVLNLVYEYRYKFRLKDKRHGWAIEALPIAGGCLGNLLTQGQVGGYLRVGYNIPDDFGSTLMRGIGHLPPPKYNGNSKSNSNWHFSFYSGCSVNMVLRDITLDGNTFKDSSRVDKNLFLPVVGFGIAIGNQYFINSFTYTFLGKEFKGQQEYSRFGAITFMYLF